MKRLKLKSDNKKVTDDSESTDVSLRSGDTYNTYNIHKIEGVCAPGLKSSGPLGMGRDHLTISKSTEKDHRAVKISGDTSQLLGTRTAQMKCCLFPNKKLLLPFVFITLVSTVLLMFEIKIMWIYKYPKVSSAQANGIEYLPNRPKMFGENIDLQSLLSPEIAFNGTGLDSNQSGIPPEVLQVRNNLKKIYIRKLSLLNSFPWMEDRSITDLKNDFHTLDLAAEKSKKRDFLKLHNIFTPGEDCEEPPLRILIEGAPGIGKTSLCIKLSVDWSLGEAYMANRFLIVFYIPAHDIKQMTLKSYFSKYLPKPNNVEYLLNYIGENQKDILFIIDGLDEVVNSLPDEWIDLITSGLGGRFINSRVLVTSRSNEWQSKFKNNKKLSKLFDIKIFNYGFTQETALRYIDSQVQGFEGKEILKQFILEHKFLLGLTDNPLFCNLLCFIWKEGYLSDIMKEREVRRTHIYVSMINCLVKRFSVKFPEKSSIKSDKLDQLQKIAYYSLTEGKEQVHLLEVQQYIEGSSIDEYDDIFKLGILVKEEEFSMLEFQEEAVFVFPHRTVREELAAEYYLKMSDEERAAATNQIVKEFPQVAIFISGLIYLRKLDHKIANSLFNALAKNLTSNDDRPYSEMTLALKCVYECSYQENLTNIITNNLPDDVFVLVDSTAEAHALLVCVFRSNAKMVGLWASQKIKKRYIYIDIVYLLPLLKYSQVNNLEIGLVYLTDTTHISQNKSHVWGKLAGAPKTNTALKKLIISECEYSVRVLEYLVEGLRFHTALNNLKLEINGTNSNRELKALAGVIKTNTALKLLFIKGVFPDEGWEVFTGALRTNTALTHLALIGSKISDRGWEALAGALGPGTNTAVKQLALKNCNISDRGWRALAGILQSSMTLTELVLSGDTRTIINMNGEEYLMERRLVIENLQNGPGWEAFIKSLKINTALTKMHLVLFNISSINIYEGLARVLETNTALTHLNLLDNMISSRGWEVLARAIENNTALKQLDINMPIATTDEKKLINDMFNELLQLFHKKQLDINMSTAADGEFKSFIGALKNNTALKQLDLDRENYRQSRESYKLCDEWWRVLKNNIALTRLEIGPCYLSDIGGEGLAEIFGTSTLLEQLSIRTTTFTDRGYKALAKLLRNNTSLKQLRMHGADIKKKFGKYKFGPLADLQETFSRAMYFFVEGWKAVAESLGTNTALTQLILLRYNMPVEWWEAFAGSLETNTALTQFHMRFCEIPDAGWKVLAGILKTNTALKQLGLRGSDISVQGWKSLAGALKINRALTELDLSQCWIVEADEGWESLAEALKTNIAITQLNVSNCVMSDRRWKALMELLRTNTALTQLYLNGIEIPNERWVALVKALKANSALKQLYIDATKISKRGLEALAKILNTKAGTSRLSVFYPNEYNFSLTESYDFHDMLKYYFSHYSK